MEDYRFGHRRPDVKNLLGVAVDYYRKAVIGWVNAVDLYAPLFEKEAKVLCVYQLSPKYPKVTPSPLTEASR